MFVDTGSSVVTRSVLTTSDSRATSGAARVSFLDIVESEAASSDAVVAQNMSDLAETASISAASQMRAGGTDDWLTLDLRDARANKPTVREFRERTGLSFRDAASLIGVGAMGYADHRDWAKIMSSSDPVSAVRQANDQLFNSADVDWAPHSTAANLVNETRIIAKSGNFAVYECEDKEITLQLIDARGRHLSQAGTTAEQIAKHAWIFGQDTSELTPLLPSLRNVSARLAYEVEAALGGKS